MKSKIYRILAAAVIGMTAISAGAQVSEIYSKVKDFGIDIEVRDRKSVV